MNEWLKRLRGAVGMGLTWAVGWTPVAVVISLIMEAMAELPPGSLIGNWLLGIVPLGLLGGMIFSSVLRVLGGKNRFEDLSLPKFGLWGAIGGLVLGSVAVAIGLVGASFGAGFGMREAVIMTTATLLSSGSAAGTLALARRAADRQLLGAHPEAALEGAADSSNGVEAQGLIDGSSSTG